MFELCRYRAANLTSCSEFMSESETVAKNRIEFQWGSKLQGTSSEALNQPINQTNIIGNEGPENDNKQVLPPKWLPKCFTSTSCCAIGWTSNIQSWEENVTNWAKNSCFWTPVTLQPGYVVIRYGKIAPGIRSSIIRRLACFLISSHNSSQNYLKLITRLIRQMLAGSSRLGLQNNGAVLHRSC